MDSNQYAAKLRSVWGAIVDRRTTGAAIMLRAPARPDQGESAIVNLETLAVQLQKQLTRHWREGERSPRVSNAN